MKNVFILAHSEPQIKQNCGETDSLRWVTDNSRMIMFLISEKNIVFTLPVFIRMALEPFHIQTVDDLRPSICPTTDL